MIKVLHVFDTLDRGGAESMIMNIYRNLDVQRVQFDFVIHTQDHCDYSEEVIKMGGNIYRAPRLNMNNVLAYVRWWNDFIDRHTFYKAMHCHVRSNASIYIPIAKKRGIKTIIHSHSTSNGKGLSAFIKMVLQYPLRFQADYLFACTEKSATWLFGRKALKQKNCIIFKNAIDLEHFKYNEIVRKQYRTKLLLRDNQLAICHVGNYTAAKNQEFLLEVISKLAKFRDCVLILVGEGDKNRTDHLKEQIDKLGIRDNVIIAGSRNDVAEILCASDVFTFPSIWEGFGIAALEAQANGLHTFVSDRVPKEIAASKLVHFLPIDKGSEAWVDSLRKFQYKREEVSDILRESGYDIRMNTQWLTEFYEKC